MSPHPTPPDRLALLDQHRRDVEALDLRILQLVCERLELARRIGELKGEVGIPVRNSRVEALVHERLAAAAHVLGLEPGVGHDLAHFLIDSAVEEQAVQRDASRPGAALDAVVVGGRGDMGRWLARFLAGQGHRVTVRDPAPTPSPFAEASDDEVRAADLVVVSVPMSRCAAVLDELAGLAPRGVVAEICSLKGHLAATADRLRAAGLRLVSFHPMFGPGVRRLEGRTVVFVSDGRADDVRLVRGLFADTSVNLVDLDRDEHDRRMGLVLGLTHLANLVFARALAHSGVAAADLAAVAGITFAKQMATTSQVSAENPDLYFEIQALNPSTPAIGRFLAAAVAEWLAAIADNDRARFTALMTSSRAAIAGLERCGGERP